MIIFVLIMFGLATIRTFTAIGRAYNEGEGFLGMVIYSLVAVTTMIAFIWLLDHFVSVTG